MDRQITMILRSAACLRAGIDLARELHGKGFDARVVFLCPGCRSGRACTRQQGSPDPSAPECFTDRRAACAPAGFQYADEDRISGMIRKSDIVLPL